MGVYYFLNSRLKAKCGSILSLSVSVSKFAMVIFKYPTTFKNVTTLSFET